MLSGTTKVIKSEVPDSTPGSSSSSFSFRPNCVSQKLNKRLIKTQEQIFYLYCIVRGSSQLFITYMTN